MKLEGRHPKILDKIAEWSLYAMIFVLPFSKSLIEITIATALVSVTIRKCLEREKPFDKNAVNLFLALFLLAALISIINSQYIALSIKAFFTKILKFAALFIVASEVIDTRKKLFNFVIIALISCIMILIDGMVQYFFLHVDLLHNYPTFNFVWTNPKVLGAPTASFPFPNDFAAWILVFIFPVGAHCLFGRKGPVRSSLLALVFIALLYSLLLTKVRGAWASFVGTLGFLALLKPKTIGAILLIMLILGGALAYKQMMPYVTSLTSVNARESMWQAGWSIFKEHPIIGSGVNTFFNKFKMAREDSDKGKKGSYAHNCYLQMACDTGLLGLAAFFAFAASVFTKAVRSLKKIKDPFYYSFILGACLGIAAFLLHSAVDTNLFSLPLATLFWLSAGILMAAVKIAGSEI